MLRYLRLWRRFAIIAFVREAEYRANFAVGVLVGAIGLGLAVLTFGILYSYTDDVAGWSRAEALMLVGIFRVVQALIELAIARNMWNVADAVRTGEMDYLLVRPVSSQFLATLRVLNLAEGVNALAGLALVVWAGNLAGVRWQVAQVAAAVVLALCGLVLLYSCWCFLVTFAFWFGAGPLESVFLWFIGAGQYPVSFFKGWVRVFFTFVFPVAFAATFPAEALLGRLDPRTLALGVALAALALIGANRFWNYGVRHYSSASS